MINSMLVPEYSRPSSDRDLVIGAYISLNCAYDSSNYDLYYAYIGEIVSKPILIVGENNNGHYKIDIKIVHVNPLLPQKIGEVIQVRYNVTYPSQTTDPVWRVVNLNELIKASEQKFNENLPKINTDLIPYHSVLASDPIPKIDSYMAYYFFDLSRPSQLSEPLFSFLVQIIGEPIMMEDGDMLGNPVIKIEAVVLAVNEENSSYREGEIITRYFSLNPFENSNLNPWRVVDFASLVAASAINDGVTAETYHKARASGQRIVVASAVVWGDNIVVGNRHHSKSMNDLIRLNPSLKTCKLGEPTRIQGFIDQRGVFMDRKEALAVAMAAGQLYGMKKTTPTDRLYSEDIYL